MNDDDQRYRVEFVSAARRDLARVPPRIVPAIVAFVYGDLSRFPRTVGKPLRHGLAGMWSARRGPYRILYEIHDARVVVMVMRVDHRADIYRPR